MTISMALPVQANVTQNEKHSITVSGKETDANATVSAYKIMNANFDFNTQQAKEPFYRWEDTVAVWLKNNNYTAYVEDVTNKVTDTFVNALPADRGKVMANMGKDVAGGALKLPAAQTATISGPGYQAVLSGLDIGGYLLLTSPDSNGKYKDYQYTPITANLLPVYNEGTKAWEVNDAEAALKGSPATIEKTANNHSVSIGDNVNYTLNVPVPTYPNDAVAKIFRIGDKLPVGITFEQGTLKVSAVYGVVEQEIASNTSVFEVKYDKWDCGGDGILDTNQGTGRQTTFILDFDYDELMQKFGKNEDKALQQIKVTYSGTINENAFGEGALENNAYTGKSDPYDSNSYLTTEDKEKVFTYGINVSKVDATGNVQLPGAEFELSANPNGSNPIKFVKESEGVYRKAKAVEEGATNLVVGDTTNTGNLLLKGLEIGTYYLKETKAPAGYELLKDPITITLTDAEANTPDAKGAGALDDNGDVKVGTGEGNIYYQTVTNKKPPIMPVTGGMGTILFAIFGVILVAGGITLIVNYTKRRHS